jgi:DNA-binding NtrC family response regulator
MDTKQKIGVKHAVRYVICYKFLQWGMADSRRSGGCPFKTRRSMSKQGVVMVASLDRLLLASTQEIGNAIGCTVVPTDTTDCALEFIHRATVRVMLIDEVLANASGLELLRRIRLASPELKVIFIAEEPSIDLEREVRSAGVSYFGNKPVNPLLLRRVLEKVLEHETRRLRQVGT